MRNMTACDAKFPAQLQDELNTQDTVCQADPRFWVVRQRSYEPCWEGEADRFSIYDGGERIGELEYYRDDLGGGLTCIPEKACSVNVPDTFFMTLRECREHIERNRRHYDESAHPFAMTAWRSPQVEKLWAILQEVDWRGLFPFAEACQNGANLADSPTLQPLLKEPGGDSDGPILQMGC